MHFLVCVDGSEQSNKALNYVQLLVQPSDTVELVNVEFEIPTNMHLALRPHEQPNALDEAKWREYKEQSLKIQQSVLDTAALRFKNQVTKTSLQGDPRHAIVEHIDKTKPSLVVLASRGLGMVTRALLGSVSEYVLHHSNCPVLIAK
ncbi:universal stress protein [Gorgonomyces haynaldii]|nr:universal stress protein [Gorgonomyces haynaldii]